MKSTNSSNNEYDMLLQNVAKTLVTTLIKEVEYAAREDRELAIRKARLYEYVVRGLNWEIERINGEGKIKIVDE